MKKISGDNKRLLLNFLIIFILGLAPLLWFKDGYLIKSEDVGLPLNFTEWKAYAYSWFNQRATGSYPIDNFSALFFLFLPALLQKLGFSIVSAQKFQFIFWFMLSGASIYYLLFSILNRRHPHPSIALCVVGFYMFNLYLEPIWLGFNIANISAYVAMPILMGLFVNGLKTNQVLKYVCLAGIVAILLSGIGVNPPIAYVCISIFILWFLYNFIILVLLKKELSAKRFLKFLTLFILIILLVNAFWIYPQGMRLLKSTQIGPLVSYKESVQQGIKERSKDTSFLNVLRLQGAWTWYAEYEEPYVLYSEFYQKNAFFLILGIIPAICAFLSIFNLRSSIFAPFFIIIALLGIIFSCGIHPPFSFIYKICLKVIPGFWIIRSPWYKWSLLTVLGFAVMIGIFIDWLIQRIRRAPLGSIIIPVLIFVAIMVYAYPIITGRMFATEEEREFLPPNYIKIPHYVYDASRWLSEKRDFFRIMVLPSMGRRITDWGYTGYEPVISYFTEKPLITPVVEGIFGSPYHIPNMDNLLYKWLYLNIDKTNTDERKKLKDLRLQKSHMIASKVLPLFNIGYLLYERDIRWDFYDRYESPELISNKLAMQRDLRFERSFGRWDFYLLENKIPHIYTTKKIIFLNGDIRAFEPLSRTDLFNYHIVFEKDLPSSLLNLLQRENLFDIEIHYNNKDISNEINRNPCFLFSTEEDNIFYKKEVPDEEIRQYLNFYFIEDTYYRDTTSKKILWIKGPGLPLKLKIINQSQDIIRTNLKFSCKSFRMRRGLYVYLNDELVQKNMLEADKDSEVRLIDLKLEPGINILSFATNQKSILHNGLKRGISFSKDFIFYANEFNINLKIPFNNRFYIYLYPYPVDDINYLPASKKIVVNQKRFNLRFNRRKIEYIHKEAISLKEGLNSIRFIHHRGEGYYLLLVPESLKMTRRLNPVKVLDKSPVRYKLEVNCQEDSNFFLIFNESYDDKWQAYILKPDGRRKIISNHFIINGYANGWYVSKIEKSGQPVIIVIKYAPQNQFWIGLLASIPTFLSCILVIFIQPIIRRKKGR